MDSASADNIMGAFHDGISGALQLLNKMTDEQKCAALNSIQQMIKESSSHKMIGEKIKVSDDSKEENLVMENCEKLEENKELPCIDLESDITIKKEPLPNSSMTSSYKKVPVKSIIRTRRQALQEKVISHQTEDKASLESSPILKHSTNIPPQIIASSLYDSAQKKTKENTQHEHKQFTSLIKKETLVDLVDDETEGNSVKIKSENNYPNNDNLSNNGRKVSKKIKREKMEPENVGMEKVSNGWMCTACGNTTQYRHNMKVHLRQHTGEKPYKCEVCSHSFSVISNLQRHMTTVHPTEPLRPSHKQYKCEWCTEMFKSRRKWVKHVTSEHPDHVPFNKYNCTHCNKTYATDKAYKEHMSSFHGGIFYSCQHCQRQFAFRPNLIRHAKTHTAERPHKCDHCEEAFKEQKRLLSHVIKEHPDKQEKPSFKCQKCGKEFCNRTNLKTHERVHSGHKPYGCSHCPKHFSIKSNLTRHERTHLGLKPYKCDICGDAFSEKKSMLTHKRIHTGERPCKCKYCGKAFAQLSTLRSHLISHSRSRDFLCGLCGKTFMRKSHMDFHVMKHNKPPTLACPHCQMKFYRRNDLKRHVMKHTQEKPHFCLVCGKGFSRLQYLREHSIQHTGQQGQQPDSDNMYRCHQPNCDSSFSDLTSLYIHKQLHNKDNRMETKENLRDYIKTTNKPSTEDKVENKPNVVSLSSSSPVFKCLVCKMLFPDILTLLRHSAQHRSPTDTIHEMKNSSLMSLLSGLEPLPIHNSNNTPSQTLIHSRIIDPDMVSVSNANVQPIENMQNNAVLQISSNAINREENTTLTSNSNAANHVNLQENVVLQMKSHTPASNNAHELLHMGPQDTTVLDYKTVDISVTDNNAMPDQLTQSQLVYNIEGVTKQDAQDSNIDLMERTMSLEHVPTLSQDPPGESTGHHYVDESLYGCVEDVKDPVTLSMEELVTSSAESLQQVKHPVTLSIESIVTPENLQNPVKDLASFPMESLVTPKGDLQHVNRSVTLSTCMEHLVSTQASDHQHVNDPATLSMVTTSPADTLQQVMSASMLQEDLIQTAVMTSSASEDQVSSDPVIHIMPIQNNLPASSIEVSRSELDASSLVNISDNDRLTSVSASGDHLSQVMLDSSDLQQLKNCDIQEIHLPGISDSNQQRYILILKSPS